MSDFTDSLSFRPKNLCPHLHKLVKVFQDLMQAIKLEFRQIITPCRFLAALSVFSEDGGKGLRTSVFPRHRNGFSNAMAITRTTGDVAANSHVTIRMACGSGTDLAGI